MDPEAIIEYLGAVDGLDWWDRIDPLIKQDSMSDGEGLVEFAGRLCYRSWAPGLNPNVTKVREDSKDYFANILDSGHGSVLEHGFYVFVFHNVSRVFCYDDETEVLTFDGWVKWPDVKGDELFAQVDPETQEMTYAPAAQRFRRHYQGPMYRLQSEQVDLMVTPHHSLYVQKHDTQAAKRGEQPWEKVPAEDIVGKRVHHLKTVLWSGVEPEKVIVPGTGRTYQRGDRTHPATRQYEGWSIPTDVWAEWLGWFVAEGFTHDDHRVTICQNAGEDFDRIVELSESLGRPAVSLVQMAGNQMNVRLSDASLHDWLDDTVGGPSWEKRVPDYVKSWSPRLLRIFLGAMVKGDGSTRKDGNHRVIYTSSPLLADDLQEVAIKAGFSANIRLDDRTGQSGGLSGIVHRRPGYIVSLVETRIRPLVNHGGRKHDSLVDYDGEVHCASVPNGLLVVRRNGKPVVCGNTHELVRHRVGVSISQESMRFVRLTDIPFWQPEWAQKDEELMSRARNVLEYLEDFQVWMADHFGLDDDGVPFAEKKAKTSYMRRYAPDGVATSIVWGANYRTLRHVIEMRTSEHAEEEIVKVFDQVADIMRVEAPLVMQDMTYEGNGHWTDDHRKV